MAAMKDNDDGGKEIRAACWLYGIEGIGNVTVRKLTALTGGSAAGVYELSDTQVEQALDKRRAGLFLKAKKEKDPDREYEKLRKAGIRFLPIFHDEYPERLKQVPDPPFALYVLGSVPAQEQPSVAVIGARECTAYGEEAARYFAGAFARSGIQVVSGMARGIDGTAQRAALAAGGRVFCILGSGADVCYPESNRRLYEAAAEAGGIISEYPPGTPPRAGNFPPRNRIISGLSDLLLVIEAREKSGTLITVDMALEQGKEIYALPGRITDPLSEGCNRLIGQGAGIALSPALLTEELEAILDRRGEHGRGGRAKENSAIKTKDKTNENTEAKRRREQTCKCSAGEMSGLSAAENEVYSLLDYEPQSISCIHQKYNARFRKINVQELYAGLVSLMLKGVIKKEESGCYLVKGFPV